MVNATNIPAASKGGDRAFTLIELLVVVTVIAVLLALLTPALDKAIELAERAKCGSNHRQFGMANQMYSQEFSHRFVPIKQQTQGASSASYYEAWYQNRYFAALMGVHGSRLLPYNNPQTGQTFDLSLVPSQVADLPQTPYWPAGLMCPAAPPQRLRQAILWNAQGMNWSGVTSQANWGNAIVIRRDQVDRPSDKVQMCDSNDWHVIGNDPDPVQRRADYKLYWDTRGDADWVSGYNAVVAYRHAEGAIVLHFDGHVAHYAKQDAWRHDQPQDARLWNVKD